MEYTEFSVQGQPGIGMMETPKTVPPHIPSYWMPYFQVANLDEGTAKAEQLGAKVMMPPTVVPNAGRFSVLTDPQGAVFALFQFSNR